jgi:hypothetical protein
VGGRRKSCRGERKARRRREKGWKEKRESRDGSLVVSWGLCWLPVVEKLVVALIGGWNGGEREGEKTAETRQRSWFLADFGPAFLLPQIMKSTSIYRRWKRAILSTLEKTFSP